MVSNVLLRWKLETHILLQQNDMQSKQHNWRVDLTLTCKMVLLLLVSQQLSCHGNFVMKTFKWYGPYSFGVDIPKMHVYISETVAGRIYDVIKNGG